MPAMRHAPWLALLALASCAVEPAPRAVCGLTAHLRVAKTVHRLGESVEFEFEVRNESAAPVEFVPVHFWDRAYTWHASTFDNAEAMLVVEARSVPLPKATSATG